MNQYNFNQNNQFGDNNMNITHLGKSPRRLNESLQKQLLELIPKNKRVDIASILGDQEAYQFAHEIKQYLESQDYNTEGVSQAVFSAPISGQIIETAEDVSKIIIGTRE